MIFVADHQPCECGHIRADHFSIEVKGVRQFVECLTHVDVDKVRRRCHCASFRGIRVAGGTDE